MRMFSSPTPRQVDLALTLLRVVMGIVFIAHGAQKLFVFGLDGVSDGFARIGIPLAALAAPLVTFAELLGGTALVLGLLTRFTSLSLAAVMLGAMFFAHLPGGFFVPDGIEFVLTLFAGTAALAITGAGSLSADALIARRMGSASVPLRGAGTSDTGRRAA